jgi:hypothetical protein
MSVALLSVARLSARRLKLPCSGLVGPLNCSGCACGVRRAVGGSPGDDRLREAEAARAQLERELAEARNAHDQHAARLQGAGKWGWEGWHGGSWEA